MKSQNKGITLASLIVTIVVLLILTTVTMRSIRGEGIIDRAHEAKEKVGNLQIEEEIRFALLELQIKEETGTVTDKAQWLRNELHGSTVTESTNGISIKYKGIIASLNVDYQIKDFFKTEEEKLEFQIEEDIQFALLKFQDMGETVEDKPQWLRNELNAALSVGEDRIIVSYNGYKIVLDSNYTIQEMFTTGEWDSTATPEDVFVWESDDPLSAEYGTVTGYTVKAKELTTLKYPSRCTKIMDCYSNGGASGCVDNIEKVEIPSTVVSFGEYAFGRSTSHLIFKKLKEVVIEEGVTTLGNNMFLGASLLETVALPDGIKSIPNSAFQSCTSLTEINIPNSVINIGAYAFRECTALTKITIPDSVTSIGYMAFYESTNIKSIVIPKTVVTMAMSVFYGWTSNQTIYVTFNSAKEKPSNWHASWSNGGGKIVYGYTGK